jgi:DNA anti-recombination protein RmuC
MADVTNELLYEVLKPVQRDLSEVKSSVGEIKLELNAVRGHLVSMQQDVHNIYGVLTRHETCLDRIEHRLEFSEPVPS